MDFISFLCRWTAVAGGPGGDRWHFAQITRQSAAWWPSRWSAPVAVEAEQPLESSRENERLRDCMLDSVTHRFAHAADAIRAAATTMVSHPIFRRAERRDLAAVGG